MIPGIFAKTFPRPDLESVLDAAVAGGFSCIHFNFACAGLPSMPGSIEPDLARHIGQALASRQMKMAGVSGTFNMIHPDRAQREYGLKRLRHIISNSPAMGTGMVSLCTGSRDPDNMWRHHPDNDRPEAWRDLCQSLEKSLAWAADHNILLGVEPEAGNVMSSAAKARQLLDDLQSPHLKIILDPANLIGTNMLDQQKEIIQDAIQLLGQDLAMAHAKELDANGLPRETLALGQGCLAWDLYLEQLRHSGFTGPLIIHGCAEQVVAESLQFLRDRL